MIDSRNDITDIRNEAIALLEKSIEKDEPQQDIDMNLTHKDRNVGDSDYATRRIQPWDIWREYDLNPWDADIIKRTLRTKKGNSRRMDYEKIMHICEERIAQLDGAYDKGKI
jgi:hypothetical protein